MNDNRCVVGRFGSATFTLGQTALALGWDERTMREFLYRRKVLRKRSAAAPFHPEVFRYPRV